MPDNVLVNFMARVLVDILVNILVNIRPLVNAHTSARRGPQSDRPHRALIGDQLDQVPELAGVDHPRPERVGARVARGELDVACARVGETRVVLHPAGPALLQGGRRVAAAQVQAVLHKGGVGPGGGERRPYPRNRDPDGADLMRGPAPCRT